MTKRELLAAIQKEREALETVLAGLSPGQMTAAGVMGEWSVKDLLGHMAMWEARLVMLLYTLERGVEPKLPRGQAQVAKINAESFAEQRERPLERVLSDFHAVHAQLLKRLEAVKERDLADAKRYKWLEGDTLEKLVAANTFEHYAEHRPMIEMWRNR